MITSARTSNLLKIVSSYTQTPELTIENYEAINSSNYSVIFSCAVKKQFSFEQYNEVLSSLTGNNLSIKPGSLIPVENPTKRNSLFKAILVNQVESKIFNEENAKGLSAVKANIFLDPENDIIWKVEGDDNNKRLVRISEEDFTELLEAKKNRNPILSSVEDVVPYHNGDYVYFFNHETNSMDFGTIVERDNADCVFTRESQKLVKLKTHNQVLLAHQNDSDHDVNVYRAKMVIAKEYNMEDYLELLRKLYGTDNPYYKAIEKAIREYSIK